MENWFFEMACSKTFLRFEIDYDKLHTKLFVLNPSLPFAIQEQFSELQMNNQKFFLLRFEAKSRIKQK